MLSKILVAGFDNDTSIEIMRYFRKENVYAEIYYEHKHNEDVLGAIVNKDKQEDIVNWDIPMIVDNFENINQDVITSFIKDNNIKQDWTMENYLEYLRPVIKEQVGDDNVLLALSGGVDSSVVEIGRAHV